MPRSLKRTKYIRLGTIVTAAFVLTGLLAVGGYREAMRPPVAVHFRLAVADMSPGRRPLRIAFMSDTHTGRPDMLPDRLRGIVAQVNALNPDLILLGGDYIKGAPFGYGGIPVEQALAPLYGLRARLGVFAVLGNNDCVRGRGGRIAALLNAGGVRVLRNEAALLHGVAVLGIDDVIHCKGNMGPAKLDYARQLKTLGPKAVPYGPVLLLSHEPVFARYAPEYVDVAFAGHTHGGQIFPAITGPLVARNAKAPKARGLMHIEAEGGRRVPLLISSGAGTNNLPIRIGVPPEIVLLTLEGRR